MASPRSHDWFNVLNWENMKCNENADFISDECKANVDLIMNPY